MKFVRNADDKAMLRRLTSLVALGASVSGRVGCLRQLV
jgi:hypothetical protein